MAEDNVASCYRVARVVRNVGPVVSFLVPVRIAVFCVSQHPEFATCGERVVNVVVLVHLYLDLSRSIHPVSPGFADFLSFVPVVFEVYSDPFVFDCFDDDVQGEATCTVIGVLSGFSAVARRRFPAAIARANVVNFEDIYAGRVQRVRHESWRVLHVALGGVGEANRQVAGRARVRACVLALRFFPDHVQISCNENLDGSITSVERCVVSRFVVRVRDDNGDVGNHAHLVARWSMEDAGFRIKGCVNC